MLGNAVRDLKFQIFGADALVEIDRRAAPIAALDRTLAGEERHQFMLADFQVAQVDLLHAAFEQRIGLARGVQIVLHFLVVDFHRYRIEREKCADVHGDVQRNLRVCWKQQFFLQHEQIFVQIDDVLLQSLNLLVQGLEFGRRRVGRRNRSRRRICGRRGRRRLSGGRRSGRRGVIGQRGPGGQQCAADHEEHNSVLKIHN